MLKRAFIIILISIIPLYSFAQSVMGIPFGSSYQTTLTSLENRFGHLAIFEENGSLSLYNFSMGDFKFRYGSFFFQYDGSKSYLNGASFSYYYDEPLTDVAKKDRDYLYSLLKDKYADEYLEEFTNEDGFKCYKFGLNPTDPSKVLGLITLSRAKGNDGVERIYLTLDYLPIHYLDKASDF